MELRPTTYWQYGESLQQHKVMRFYIHIRNKSMDYSLITSAREIAETRNVTLGEQRYIKNLEWVDSPL